MFFAGAREDTRRKRQLAGDAFHRLFGPGKDLRFQATATHPGEQMKPEKAPDLRKQQPCGSDESPLLIFPEAYIPLGVDVFALDPLQDLGDRGPVL